MHTVFRICRSSYAPPNFRPGVMYGLTSLLAAACLFTAPANAQMTGQVGEPGGGRPDHAALTAGQWQEDLDYLSVELAKKHADLFSLVRRKTYYDTVDEVAGTISSLNPGRIVAGFIRVAALLNDENTLVWPFQPTLGYHILPVQAYWFDDGVYITRADQEYGHVVGSRIAGIGGKDITEVFDAFTPLIGAENYHHKKSWISVYGFCPELLHARGFTDRLDMARFTLVNPEGETYEVDVYGVPFSAYAKRFFLTPVENVFTPVITNRRARNYWYRYLPEIRTIYLQINEIRDQQAGETVEEFTSELAAFVDTTEIDRFVVDLRRRGGGDRYEAARIADTIAGHEKINRRDRLFTVIGRATSGPLLELASMLEYRTKTVFVGEPTGEGPNGVGDSETITLPNSKIEVYYTKQFRPTSILEDERRWIAPDIRVSYLHQDFLDRRDPAMEAIVAYQPERRDELTVSIDEALHIVGRYLFTPYQILEIRYVDYPSATAPSADTGRLAIEVTDFIETSIFKVKSDLYALNQIKFATDIRDVEINIPAAREKSAGQLFINWKGHEKAIQRASNGFLLPVELIQRGRIEAGITALLSDAENRRYYRLTAGRFLVDTGYVLLERKRFDDAIRVFRANTELYPEEAAAWDNLADAFLAKGERELAAKLFEKSLKLDPNNAYAADKLKELE